MFRGVNMMSEVEHASMSGDVDGRGFPRRDVDLSSDAETRAGRRVGIREWWYGPESMGGVDV